MRILFIGDVQGQGNIMKLQYVVPDMKSREKINAVIINGENSADGNGITPYSAKLLFDRAGADVITTGNHAFKRKEADTLYDERSEVLRPANFGEKGGGCPGWGVHTLDFGYCELCVVNIMGMNYMPRCDNPFRCMDAVLAQVTTPNIIVDFHAESTGEKKAMAYYLQGRVSAVLGTHTHVQTADEQIIGGHTAFISDVGMVGAADSVIGAEKEGAILALTDCYPQKYMFAEGKAVFNAVVVEIDESTGAAESIKRINRTI
jgi:hypothetical protein